MALIIICMTGASNTGKSSTIRRFTAEHLNYTKDQGDVLGVFPMPRRDYAVGVSGYGDNLSVLRDGLAFLENYDGLRVMIVACHLGRSVTFREVASFARRTRARLHHIPTIERTSRREQNAAIQANVRSIVRLMPRRER